MRAKPLHVAEGNVLGNTSVGIVHDLNNVLMAILACADRASRRSHDEPFVSARLREILHVAADASEMARRLTGLARGTAMPIRLGLDEAIARCAETLRTIAGENVEVLFDLDARGVHTRCDASCIEQVALNLVFNARDAMPAGGSIYIATRIASDDYVELIVRDTGRGMVESEAEHLFDELYSTKGTGSGIGLCIVERVVAEQDGRIEVQSEVGQGTTFTISLPQERRGVEREADRRAPTRRRAALIVDDTPSIRDALADILSEEGYVTTTAATVERARELIERDPCDFDVMLTDDHLPDGRGVDFARELRVSHPELAVVILSGMIDLDDLMAQGLAGRRHTTFLQKPVSVAGVLEALADVLRP